MRYPDIHTRMLVSPSYFTDVRNFGDTFQHLRRLRDLALTFLGTPFQSRIGGFMVVRRPHALLHSEFLE